MGLNRLQFSFREHMRILLVAQNGQAGFLIENLAAEWVDHANFAFAYRAHDRVIDTATLD